MKKMLTSYQKLPKVVKQILKDKYPEEDLWKYLNLISETEEEAQYGLFVEHEDVEYLVKMMKLPKHTKLNSDKYMDSLSNNVRYED